MANLPASGAVQPDVRARDELAELASILWSARWQILAVAILAGGIGLAAAALMRPTYRASVIVALASESSANSGIAALAGQFAGLAGLAGVNIGAGGGSESMGILRSRTLGDRFIAAQGIVGQLADAAGTPVATGAELQEASMNAAYEFFDETVRTIADDAETGLVRVQFDWYDRHEAANWANEYVKLANQVVRERSIEQAEMRLQYLTDAVEKTESLELRQALFSLIESEAKSRMLASIDSEIAYRVIDSAVASAVDDPVRPDKVLMSIMSFVAGLFFAVVFFYVRGLIRLRRIVSVAA